MTNQSPAIAISRPRSDRVRLLQTAMSPTEMQPKANDVEATVTWTRKGGDSSAPAVMERADMRDGQALEFGVAQSDGGIRSSIGVLEVIDSCLLVSNLTGTSTFVIENIEDSAELVKARPRHLRVSVPFEISRVLIPVETGVAEMTVFGFSPRLLGTERISPAHRVRMPKLDIHAKYFAVLVALCEPRLRESSMAAVPSVNEVVDRLRGSSQFRQANRSSINYHIDYLADQKLPVGQWAKYDDRGRMHAKREALAAFALRFDLVREEHLALLPSRVTWRPGPLGLHDVTRADVG